VAHLSFLRAIDGRVFEEFAFQGWNYDKAQPSENKISDEGGDCG
jgi:hypothetical protein